MGIHFEKSALKTYEERFNVKVDSVKKEAKSLTDFIPRPPSAVEVFQKAALRARSAIAVVHTATTYC